jgi:O-antigen/teichoic acid export membrane protein
MSSQYEISKKLLLVNSASSVMGKVLNVSVLVWLNAYLLDRIGPEQFSLWPVLTTVILLMPTLTSVLTSGLGRYILAAYAQDDQRRVTQITSTMFVPLLATGALLLAGGLLLAWHVDSILSIPAGSESDARIMVALLVFSVAIRPPLAPFCVGLYVRQKFVLQNVIRLSCDVVRLSLLFILLFGVSTRVLWVIVANVVGELLTQIVLLIWSRRLIPALKFRVREIRWELTRELISFGGWNFLAVVAHRLRQTAMPLILNKLATPMDVSLFHVGSLGRRQIDQWTYVATAPLYPVVTGLHAMGAKDRIRNLYLRGGRISLWVTLAVSVPALIYASEIMQLYVGSALAAAGFIMVLTLAGLPISLGTSMVWGVAHATGNIRPVGIRNSISQLTTIGVALYLVGVAGWGAIGPAYAALVVGSISTVVLVWPLGLKLADVKFDTWIRETLFPGLAPAAAGAVVWTALKLTVEPDSWSRLGLCSLLGGLCYGAVLLRFCLAPRDRADLAQVIAKIKPLAGIQRLVGKGA